MLADIAAAIGAQLQAAGQDVPVLVGARYLYKNDGAPPRIVLVPQGAQGKPPFETNLGGPRNLYSRELQVNAHLWGADYGAAEQLLVALVQALQIVMGATNYEYGGEKAPEGDRSVTTNGEVILATFVLRMAIPDAGATPVQVTHYQQTGVMTFPDGDNVVAAQD